MTKKFLLQVIYPGELKRDVHTKNSHANVHSHISRNIRKVKTTEHVHQLTNG